MNKMIADKSKQAFEEAKKYIPGGVNSPVRAFKSVGTFPRIIKKAHKSTIEDIDGNQYVDFISSWGPLLFGHSHPAILEAIQTSMQSGLSFGAPTEVETTMAKLICELIPSVEKVRMVNSGTEATMSAVRLARGYTKRDKFIKFEGCYHGHGDSFLIKAGSGALTFGAPNSPGVTEGTAKDTLVATYNELDSVKKLFEENKGEIAAIIVEPIAGNMGLVLPKPEFLQGLRDICDENCSVLIFDEVISGFRASSGGAQKLYGITPDLTCLGKIIGGGLPVGAYGGKERIMNCLAPEGDVYQAGTLSGNPVAMHAGVAMLNLIKSTENLYKILEEKAIKLEDGFKKNLAETGVNAVINRIGSLLTLFFVDGKKVDSFADLETLNTEKYSKYFNAMLEQGIFLPPSQYEAMFVSYAHTEEDVQKTIDANLKALKQL
jgi:glutamate-1-semialdehyde 2,1-aminomutase